MAKENRTKFVLLGLLSWRPMSGYDLKKTIETSISNFWTESYGQIYPMLKRLTAEGLVTRSVEKQVGKPDRYLHTLTDTGREELLRWLTEPVEHQGVRIELLLKLFFGRQVAVADSVRQAQQFRALQQQLCHKYDAIETWLQAEHTDHPDLPYWLMTVSYGRHASQALIHWCDETLVTLSGMAEQSNTRNTRGDLTP